MPMISIRVTEDDYAAIKSNAKQSGLSISEYGRKALLSQSVHSTLPQKEMCKLLCTTHNRMDDAKTLPETQQIFRDLEVQLWQLIK